MRWLIFIIFYILIDIYAFQVFRTFSKSIWLNGIYIALSVGVLAVLIYTLTHLDRSNGITIDEMYVLGWFLVFFVPKLILIVFMFGEDIDFCHRIKDLGVNLIWQTGTSFQNKAQQYITDVNVKGINVLCMSKYIFSYFKKI